MDFAIIAAGEGSRLKAEGFDGPKPMVPLLGLPMIHRLINIFTTAKAERIFIIINEQSAALETYLNRLVLPVRLQIIKKSTPDSLHSFYELSRFFVSDEICLTTVDTVFDEEEFARYVEAFTNGNMDGLMAVTTFVDDESPLFVSVDDDLSVTAFLDDKAGAGSYVSGGVYCFRNGVMPLVEEAINNGVSRMRNFQRLLLEKGHSIKAYPFTKIIDIDHVQDISLAEQWLAERAVDYSG